MKVYILQIIFLVSLQILFDNVSSISKYSKEVNEPTSQYDLSSDKPFRMNKVNLLWSKAKQRLGPEKLKILAEELRKHDKEELNLKRIKADGKDKAGLLEADIRKKFHYIMEKYDLLRHMDQKIKDFQPSSFNEVNQDLAKAVFKDKKLNKLWMKAEESNEFSIEDLMTLKQEFKHHQEKIEEYHELLNELHAEEKIENDKLDNSINQYLNKESKTKLSNDDRIQSLREKHVELKSDYDKLNLKAVGSGSSDFKQTKVRILWKLAKEADFSSLELDSLKEELEHFEQRLTKLNHLESELDSVSNRLKDDQSDLKHDTHTDLSKRVKQLSHKVNKLHEDIETRIKSRHSEL